MDNSRISKGFTLVELIIVIIILGIVSTFAASRYIGTSSFSAYAAQEQAIAIIRQLQVYRMQSNITDATTKLDFQLTASNGCVGSTAGCNATSTPQGSANRSDVMRIDGVTITSTQSPINFDLLGSPLNAASSGITVTLSSGNDTTALCINQVGYVGRGACL